MFTILKSKMAAGHRIGFVNGLNIVMTFSRYCSSVAIAFVNEKNRK